MNSIHQALYRAGLVRSTRHRMLGGVCGGLAEKTGVDPNAMRLLVFLLMVVVPGSPLLLYPIAWVAMPDDTFGGQLPPAYPQDRLHR